MVWIYQNDLEPALAAVFADPVGVKNAEVWIPATCTLLGDALGIFRSADAIDALPFRSPTGAESGFSCCTLAYACAHDNYPLFCFVPKRTSPVDAGRSLDALDSTLLTPSLLALPLELAEFTVVWIVPCLSNVRVVASCHGGVPGALMVQPHGGHIPTCRLDRCRRGPDPASSSSLLRRTAHKGFELLGCHDRFEPLGGWATLLDVPTDFTFVDVVKRGGMLS